MNRHSPVVAMLWENWRLTRVEAAQRLGLGIVGASAALVLSDNGAGIALWILLAVHWMFWLSISKLNGGRFLDGYKPGFPLYLLYTRPVPTATFVGVALAYDAISGAALYVVSALVVGAVFDQPLPLFSAALWIVASRLAYTCCQWSTQSRAVQWTTQAIIGLSLFLLLNGRMASPPLIEFSTIESVLMVLLGVVSVGLAIVGVARQRRGDGVATAPRAAGSTGYPDWLISLFRFPCPTSSATKAQVWFELKSSGLPVLTIGLAIAIVVFLLFAISIPIVPMRNAAVSGVMFFAPAMLLCLGGNAFGIRRRQGRTYASTFEATQPYGTAQLARLKVFVRSGCVLVALAMVGISVWASSSLLSAWGTWVVAEGKDTVPGLLRMRGRIGELFGGLTGQAFAAQISVALFAVAAMVASLATFAALRARYPRRVLVAAALLLLYGLVLVLLLSVGPNGITWLLLNAILWATPRIAVAALVTGTIYLTWRSFAERLLTLRAACGAILVSVACAAAAQMFRPTDAVGMLLPALLLFAISVLTPWSLGRIRHT